MTNLTSLLMKNIDLILEAYNIDDKGNLVAANKRKVAEADEVFHQYFVKSMNKMFKQINENDPIMHDPNNMMDPMHSQNGMHAMAGQHGMMPHDMGMGDPMGGQHMGDEQMGGMHDPMGDPMGGQHMSDEHMGAMAMDDMHDPSMGGSPAMGGGMGGAPSAGPAMESADYDWVFGENADLDIDSLFNLTEEDKDEEEEGCEEDEHEHLKEFMDDMDQGEDFIGHSDGMDMEGGHNDFGGDMGGVDMDLGSSMDQHMGGDMGGDDMGGDMVTIHGQMDNGGDFEFSFDKDALDFDGGDDMGGDMGDMGGDHDMGGDMDSEPEHGEHEEPGFGDEEDEHKPPMAEAAGRKPGKGKRGPKTARMSIVPANPAVKHAAPFPTPQGQRQKK